MTPTVCMYQQSQYITRTFLHANTVGQGYT